MHISVSRSYFHAKAQLRLHCGVLHHVANRTLSFHGVADAVQFLLPLLESWTSIEPCLYLFWMTHVFQIHVFWGVFHRPLQLRPLLRSLVYVLWYISWLIFAMANNDIACLWDEVSQIRTQLASGLFLLLPWEATVLCFAATLFVPPQSPRLAQFGSARRNVHRSEARQVRQCRMRGCHTAVPRSCDSGFCVVHCTSLRCTLHRRRQPVCSSPNCSAFSQPLLCCGLLRGALLSPTVFSKSSTSSPSSSTSTFLLFEDVQGSILLREVASRMQHIPGAGGRASLLQVARHVRATPDLPMVLAGDANVWHSHFNLGRRGAVNGLIVPLVVLRSGLVESFTFGNPQRWRCPLLGDDVLIILWLGSCS